MECRFGCAVCCIDISISSPIPGMPLGKAAGVRCVQLTDDLKCKIFNDPSRPEICSSFKPEIMFCGNTTEDARKTVQWLLQK